MTKINLSRISNVQGDYLGQTANLPCHFAASKQSKLKLKV